MVVEYHMVHVTRSVVKIADTNKKLNLNLFEALSALAVQDSCQFVENDRIDAVFGSILYGTILNAFKALDLNSVTDL